MKASELIEQLQQLIDEHDEDFDISVRDSSGGLADVEIITVLNQRHFGKFIAIQKGIINLNPLQQVAGIKGENNKREYLSIDELKSLVKTDCRYPDLKNAFLFGCLTGLRWSDINQLTWADVQELDGHQRIIFKQQKTKGLQYLDISPQAYALMGEKKTGRVFVGLRYSAYMNVELLRWCMAAGISKHITFHASRHTFAVTQLTMGTDIYTVSRLLGHSEIKTTEIYADIIDSKRKLAIMTLLEINQFAQTVLLLVLQ